jgi:hypothetical protein
VLLLLRTSTTQLKTFSDMSSRGLPGFLRRSLRVEYADGNDDNGNDDTTGINNSILVDEDLLVLKSSAGNELSHQRPEQESSVGASNVQQHESELHSENNHNSMKELSELSESSKAGESKLYDSWQQAASAPSAVLQLPPPPKLSYREVQYDKVLGADVVNLAELKKLAWNGIPDANRADAWKLLLGYLPTNAARRQQNLHRRRNEYRDAIAQHYDIDDNSRTNQEQETLRQVLVDVPRTAPDVPLFRNERVRRILTRLLYIWAIRHPASSYVQGINDLATPLLSVFLADYFDGQGDVLDGHVMNHLSEEHLDQLEADGTYTSGKLSISRPYSLQYQGSKAFASTSFSLLVLD